MADFSQDDQFLLRDARDVLRSEAASIGVVAEKLDGQIVRAMRLILERTDAAGREGGGEAQRGGGGHGVVVVSGLGKPGLTGQRISASFASTGTPSHFLHPVEAMHGDLGRVRREDVALLLSYSGETEELVRLVDLLKRQHVPVIAITASAESALGQLADITVAIGNIEEVCPHGLAPTTSVNCLSAVGDALVLGVMSLRKFSKEDFAAFHPGGSIGRRLLRVSQVMEFKVGENFETLAESTTLREALAKDPSSGRRAGAVVIVDAAGVLAGVFTDGDLRRRLRSDAAVLDLPLSALMTRNPKHISERALASEALALLNKYRIDELPVVDDAGRPVGLVDVQDLVRLRIVE